MEPRPLASHRETLGQGYPRLDEQVAESLYSMSVHSHSSRSISQGFPLWQCRFPYYQIHEPLLQYEHLGECPVPYRGVCSRRQHMRVPHGMPSEDTAGQACDMYPQRQLPGAICNKEPPQVCLD